MSAIQQVLVATGGATPYQAWGAACVWSPTDKNANNVISGAGLVCTASSGAVSSAGRATVSHSTGRWRFQLTIGATATARLAHGVGTSAMSLADNLPCGQDLYGWAVQGSGLKYHNGSTSAYMAAPAGGDVWDIYYDADAGTLGWAVNGVAKGFAFTGLTGTAMFPAAGGDSGCFVTANFGATAFTYPTDVF